MPHLSDRGLAALDLDPDPVVGSKRGGVALVHLVDERLVGEPSVHRP